MHSLLKNYRNKGFTLIELLIVIAIIGILATIVLININSARKKAKAAKAVSDLYQIEQALSAWGIDEGITKWWHEDTWGAPTDEPRISWLVENTSLGVWLSTSPQLDTNLYVYDNDDDTFDTDGDGCGDFQPWRGVHLNIWDESLIEVVEIMDKMVDKGDGDICGKIVWDPEGAGGYFIGYRLGNNSDDLKF